MPGPGPKYIDHPAPSVVMVLILLVVMGLAISTIPAVRGASQGSALILFWVFSGLILIVAGFYFWPFYSTYYTVSSDGIEVWYGPWKHKYPWSDFAAAYWQKGMFATRIGWPSVTPCVRLTNAVLLERKRKGSGLYLTPNDPRAFLQRIGEFAPELTARSII